MVIYIQYKSLHLLHSYSVDGKIDGRRTDGRDGQATPNLHASFDGGLKICAYKQEMPQS